MAMTAKQRADAMLYSGIVLLILAVIWFIGRLSGSTDHEESDRTSTIKWVVCLLFVAGAITLIVLSTKERKKTV